MSTLPILSSHHMRSARPLLKPGCRRLLNVNTPRRRWSSTHSTAGDSSRKPSSVLTLLHKASNLLPRALPPNELALHQCLFDASRLSLRTKDDVVRVALYPLDEWAKSDARLIISALLQEPFATDDARNKAIRERPSSGLIQSASKQQDPTSSSASSSESFVTSSPYLYQHPLHLEISELETSPDIPLHKLLSSDIPIIVCNPLTSSPSSIPQSVRDAAGAAIIITSSSSISPELESNLKAKLRKPDILFVDPTQAVHALSLLQQHNYGAFAVNCYQQEFTSSRIRTVSEHIRSFTLDTPETLHSKTAYTRLSYSIHACENALKDAQGEANVVLDRIAELRDAIERLRAVEWERILPEDGKRIRAALDESRKEMKPVLDGLTLWKLVWRVGVDDVGEVVGGEVRRRWCRSLEDQLILHTGRLSALQQSLDEKAFSLVSDTPSPLRSELLLNTLLQLSPALPHASSPSQSHSPSPSTSSTTSSITTTHRSPSLPSKSLTSPIHHRRTQLLTFPTSQLHLAAQRAVLSVFTGLSTGTGVGVWWIWSSTASPLVISTAGGGGTDDIIIGAALGTSVALVGIRYALGLWARAKRRWWDDWERVGDGLERDLKAELEGVLEGRVLAVGRRACEGLEVIARGRLEEVREVRAGVRGLRGEVDLSRGERK